MTVVINNSTSGNCPPSTISQISFTTTKVEQCSTLVYLNMTQIDESTSLSIQLRIRKEAVKYPAKTHAYKVKRELAASDSSSTTGLIYLPGQNSEQYEDTDGY